MKHEGELMNDKPNILLITADSLRADFVGCFNHDKTTSATPNIDRFAEESILFNNYFSQGNRTPVAFPSILSGQYAFLYGFDKKLDDKRLLLQEILKENKYNTLAIHSNPFISTAFNYNRGFDIYNENINKFYEQMTNKKLKDLLRRLDIFINGPYSTGKTINKQFYAALRNLKNNSFFAWLHYMDTHGPYIKKKGWKQYNLLRGSMLWHKAMNTPQKITNSEHKELISTYYEEISYFDFCFQEVLSNIDLEQTIVIFTADHGELLGEHGVYGHDHNHFEPLFRVPFIIRIPEKYYSNKHKVIEHLSQSIDICPTILDILGIKHNYNFNGESLAPYILDDAKMDTNKIVIHEIRKGYYCVRDYRFKYVYIDRHDQNFEALYDLKNDPEENKDCLFTYQDSKELANLKKHLNEYLNLISMHDNYKTDNIEPSENIQERLKALGYM